MSEDKPFNDLLLQELAEIKANITEVRVTDIPNLKVEINGLKKDVSTSSKIYSGLGSGLAVAMAYLLERLHK